MRQLLVALALLAPVLAGCGASDQEVKQAADAAAKAATERLMADLAADRAAAALAEEQAAAERKAISGTLTIMKPTGNGQYGARPDPKNEGECLLNPNSEAGFSDIRTGTQVTVKDSTGNTVGVSSLGPAAFVNTYTEPREGFRGSSAAGIPDEPSYVQTWGYCQRPFTVTDLPVAPFYSVEVASRGALNFSSADLQAKGWAVAITLGEGG